MGKKNFNNNIKNTKVVSDRNRLIEMMKSVDENVGLHEEDVIIYTGVKSDLGNEITLYMNTIGDGMVRIETDDTFGAFIETKYSSDEIESEVFRLLKKKRHKGVVSFDVEKWAITGYCKIEEYPYVKWTITELVDDICTSVV